MDNSLEQERLKFQPTLPLLLRKIETLHVVHAGPLPPLNREITSLFPCQAASHAVVHFKPGEIYSPLPLRVGVVFSGGQAAGGHNVITGLFDALTRFNTQPRLFGFLGGPEGLVENRYIALDRPVLAPYRNMGGFDLIGSGRVKIETPQQFEAVLKNCLALKLDGVVIIGGDDSNTNAVLLAEYFLTHKCSTRVIGVPKTIDGDLKSEDVEISFGFDTACKTYSEMISNICRDALSAKKYTHFIKLMGRSASHVTLECALQTHPNYTLIGEEIAARQMTLDQVVDALCTVIGKRAEKGDHFGVVLIPEGLIEFIPEMTTLVTELNRLLARGEPDILANLSAQGATLFTSLPKEIGQQLLLDRDPHGNIQVSQIATEQLLIQLVKKRLKTGKFNPLGHFLGYEGRSGYPSNFDANYCYALGYTAAALIRGGVTGYMSTLQNLTELPEKWVPVGIPLVKLMALEERKGKRKPVIKKALVDLEGEPFKFFVSQREEWALYDRYRFVGPIQFAGPSQLCDSTPFTLNLDSAVGAGK
jgi:diphosphate-dependent phosphofructokinase